MIVLYSDVEAIFVQVLKSKIVLILSLWLIIGIVVLSLPVNGNTTRQSSSLKTTSVQETILYLPAKKQSL